MSSSVPEPRRTLAADPARSQHLAPFLTARELAERLRVHPKTILAWVRHEKLPCTRLPGGRTLYVLTQVLRWLELRREGQT